MSTALTGPTALLGIEMRTGVLAGFARCNRAGGVHGRQLNLIAFDDGYQPRRGLKGEYAIVHARGANGRPVIVALTAHAMAGDRQRCLEAGMDDSISKPAHARELERVLSKWLAPTPSESSPARCA